MEKAYWVGQNVPFLFIHMEDAPTNECGHVESECMPLPPPSHFFIFVTGHVSVHIMT